jgi:hypothetical protein
MGWIGLTRETPRHLFTRPAALALFPLARLVDRDASRDTAG